jgi:hypothetical protein
VTTERPARRALSALERFALRPASPAPLAALRIGLACVLLWQAAMVAPVLFELYGDRGVLQGPLREALAGAGLPRIGWLVRVLGPLGVREASIVAGVGGVYVIALLALLGGLRTRVAAAVAWITHLMLMTTAEGSVYGADVFANTFLFYLVWAPAGATLSLDRRRGRATEGPTPAARLALRVVQMHLSGVYLASGVEKACGEGWWNGEAIWRALMLPEYRRFDFSFLAAHPWVAAAAGWSVLLVEIGYPIFMWSRRTRRPWVWVTAAMHLGIALLMRLEVFGAIMIVLNVAAFGVTARPPRRRRRGGGADPHAPAGE